MSNSKEVNEDYQRAFKIARKKLDLTKEHVEVFEKVKGFLDDVIVDKIDSFKPGNKGILLIGGDYYLLSGVVSYIWYRHPLIYPVSGNNSIRSKLGYINFASVLEDKGRDFIFSDSGLFDYMHGCVLFLRNIKTEYPDILERIAAILQEIDDSPLIREKESRIIHHPGLSVEDGIYDFDDPRIQRRKEEPKFKILPSILVMNIKQTEELPEDFSKDFLQNFEVIELEPGKKSKIIPQQQSLDQKSSDIIHFPTPPNSTWIHVEMGIDYYNKKLHTKVKSKFKIHPFSKVGLSHGHSKEDKPTDLLKRLIEYANAENNVIYTEKLTKKLESDNKRLNRLFRSYFETIEGPAISYKKGEGFKVQFGKLYLIATDYDKAREVTTNKLQDIPDSNIEDNESLD